MGRGDRSGSGVFRADVRRIDSFAEKKETLAVIMVGQALGKPPSLALGSFPGDNPPDCHFFRKTGAGEEIRTLDPNLGKVVLYP